MPILRQERGFVKMKIKAYCGIGYHGAGHSTEMEVDDSELEGMTEGEKEEYIQENYVAPFANEYLEAWYEEITD